MNELKLIETVKTNNPSEPDTYQRKVNVFINAQCFNYDVVDFCNQKGIQMTNMRLVSRLFQFDESVLNQVWKVGMTDPSQLYQAALHYTKELSFGGNL